MAAARASKGEGTVTAEECYCLHEHKNAADCQNKGNVVVEPLAGRSDSPSERDS
jgi:hypothetical protein